MVRDSNTNPLEIAAVQAAAGTIGMTFCPGKKGPSVYGPPWRRDLTADLEKVKEWKADVVVTLMEAHELAELKVPQLGTSIEAAGLEWRHLPIVDADIPDTRFHRRWIYEGHGLREHLKQGRRVLIHCRGGLGRTGLVAGQLLVELGNDPCAAIDMVRAARPGAIEPVQEQYVLSCRPCRHDHDYLDRVLGCLMGGAIGDAFGYAIEFDRLADIRRRFGTAGLQNPVFDNGRLVVSDDTQMTLFTAIGLGAALGSGMSSRATVVQAIRTAYLDWLQTQRGSFEKERPDTLLRYPELWVHRAPGNTCLSGLAAGGGGTPEEPINDSKGCGGVMRTAPIGLALAFDGDAAFDLGARAAAITHGHPSGYLSAAALSGVVHDLIGGLNLRQSLARTRRRLLSWPSHDETLSAVDSAVALAESSRTDHASNIRRLGEGWVGEEALAIAIYATLTASSFKDAIRAAANHDGDSDSTASITGQIWGAASGLNGIPHAWATRLDVLDPLCEAASAILSCRLHFNTAETNSG